MAEPIDALYASDGTAPAVRATVSSDRLPTDMDLITDSVANWPHKGIATSGTPDDDGVILEETICVFTYVLTGTIIHITGFAPGYYDVGHTENQIVIIKPTTYHMDSLVDAIGEGGASVTIGDTPPADAEPGDLWGDTSDDSLQSIVTSVGSLLFPIGQSIITSNPANPATYYGFGTWEEDAKGRTIVGVDSTQTEFTPVGKTGGHKLLQAHTHANRWNIWFPSGTGSLAINDRGGDGLMVTDNAAGGEWFGANTPAGNSAGGGDSQNLQPYITKYVWTRIA